uniref:Uncharacterized protein n=1 Tax=Oryza barthii TaxID=65489 RepID=A0A0D3EN86_9ORYZ
MEPVRRAGFGGSWFNDRRLSCDGLQHGDQDLQCGAEIPARQAMAPWQRATSLARKPTLQWAILEAAPEVPSVKTAQLSSARPRHEQSAAILIIAHRRLLTALPTLRRELGRKREIGEEVLMCESMLTKCC